jgi:hypothetical protein
MSIGRRQSRDTGNMGHRTKTILRHWQHLVHKTQDEDNSETLATLNTQDTGKLILDFLSENSQ